MNDLQRNAGRELDALILKHVFRASVEWGESGRNGNTTWNAGFYGTWVDDKYRCYDEGNYSTNIAKAWQIVEKFRHGDDRFVAACMELHLSDACEEKDWYCTFYAPDLAKHEVWAETAPLAICLAALKAVGIDISSLK